MVGDVWVILHRLVEYPQVVLSYPCVAHVYPTCPWVDPAPLFKAFGYDTVAILTGLGTYNNVESLQAKLLPNLTRKCDPKQYVFHHMPKHSSHCSILCQ